MTFVDNIFINCTPFCVAGVDNIVHLMSMLISETLGTLGNVNTF